MKFKILLVCFLALVLQTQSSDLNSLTQAYEKLLLENTETIQTLSAKEKFEQHDKLTLTSGGTTSSAYKLHEQAKNAIEANSQLLSYKKYNNKDVSYMRSYYKLPEQYCPEKDYNYFNCDIGYPYRSMDGSCNNLKVPWWGKKETPYKRLLPPQYEDGYNAPKTLGGTLPNPREVAMKIHRSRKTSPDTTQFLTFFAQFVDHDLTLTSRTAYPNGEQKPCMCGPESDKDEDCFNIPTPLSDYYNKDQSCFPFTRSSAAINDFDCRFMYREQLDLITAWLDLNNIYGSSSKTTNLMRTGNGGLLKVSKNPYTGADDLPLIKGKNCLKMKPSMNDKCYFTGEARTEDNHYLTMFSKIFYKEHNRIAKILSLINPSWDDEYLFQEARKINIARYNHIIYWEFLPILLGKYAMEKYDLIPLKEDFFREYDPKVNPQVSNEFSTAAMRFGHVMVNKYHYGYDSMYNLVGNWTTDSMVFNHKHGYKNNHENILRGALVQTSYYFTSAVNDYMNHYLFVGLSDEWARLSLPALNIQRGRDHGLPGYNQYRQYCGLNAAVTFNDFDNIPLEIRKIMAKLYNKPDDVDLFTGLMSEYAVEDGVLGYTASCIIAEGFHDWKYGDRFFYENQDSVTGFKIEQLNEIRKTTMAQIVCENTDISYIQRNPFKTADEYDNPLIDCNSLSDLDFSLWVMS